ncbi:unnamed protein product [Gadus morhua 'NCC']
MPPGPSWEPHPKRPFHNVPKTAHLSFILVGMDSKLLLNNALSVSGLPGPESRVSSVPLVVSSVPLVVSSVPLVVSSVPLVVSSVPLVVSSVPLVVSSVPLVVSSVPLVVSSVPLVVSSVLLVVSSVPLVVSSVPLVRCHQNPGPYGPVWSCSGGLITSATASEGQRTGEEQEPGSARAPPP